MKRLDYCPPSLGYIVYPSEKEIINDLKVRMIQDINHIQKCLGKGALSVQQFDELWDSPTDYLTSIIHDQASLLFISL